MSVAGVISVASDSASSLSGLDLSSHPNIAVKPAEIRWNDMQTEDLHDSTARALFARNAEIIPKTSGFVEDSRWNWTDFLAEESVENDAIFVFVPHSAIYPGEKEQVMKAAMELKTAYADFFNRHQRKTGKIKHFVIQSGNVFGGVGLIVWQCQEILSRMDPQKNLSLVQLKELFEKYAARTRTISIMDCGEMGEVFKSRLMEHSLIERMTSSLRGKNWMSVQFNQDQVILGERQSLEAQLSQHVSDLVVAIENDQLAFPRVVICCSGAQWDLLKGMDLFKQLNRFIEGTPVKLMHQQQSISSQVLTGQNAIHISYSAK